MHFEAGSSQVKIRKVPPMAGKGNFILAKDRKKRQDQVCPAVKNSRWYDGGIKSLTDGRLLKKMVIL